MRNVLPLIIFVALITTFNYNNCSSPKPVSIDEAALKGGHTLPEINYFKEPRPSLICGRDGYAFLMRNYIKESCAGCHKSSGVASSSFADDNVDNAYFNALSVSDENWKTTVTKNKFCGPGCDLQPEGEIYKGIEEWLKNSKVCP